MQSRSLSDPPLSDIETKNKMAWIWTTLEPNEFVVQVFLFALGARSGISWRGFCLKFSQKAIRRYQRQLLPFRQKFKRNSFDRIYALTCLWLFFKRFIKGRFITWHFGYRIRQWWWSRNLSRFDEASIKGKFLIGWDYHQPTYLYLSYP